jgi:hypothetical protein
MCPLLYLIGGAKAYLCTNQASIAEGRRQMADGRWEKEKLLPSSFKVQAPACEVWRKENI